MSVLRPEDNVDNDAIVLIKHSVLKKTQLAKGDLMDGLTGQNMLGNFFPDFLFFLSL